MKIAKSRRARSEDSRRSRIVLDLGRGLSLRAISATQRCSVNTVRLWRDRFAKERLAGLYSRHRGREPQPGRAKLAARIIDWTLHRRPSGEATQWSTRRLARELGTTQTHVSQVWRKVGLQPHRLRHYMASNDPDFQAKAADVIGFYLRPPLNAAVFSLDEKSAIQALDRRDPVLPLSPGRAERHGFEYYRHGTLSLYAALDVRTGQVLGKTAARHTSAEFVAFLADVVATQPASKEIHLIVDNLSAHKTKRVTAFMSEHPKVIVHYTPTYSSWLNQVELWFSKIQRDLIARGIFTSKNDLKRKIMRYIRSHNANAKPFKWTYRNMAHRIAH
ncbi:MAG: IS630 family transposase [Chthoniobacterales bacterium]